MKVFMQTSAQQGYAQDLMPSEIGNRIQHRMLESKFKS